MAEVVLFHHAHGLTPGVISFADRLRAAGHTVHTPDLYEGRVFDNLDDGVRYVDEEVGFEPVLERGRAAVENLPNELVYAGFSLGAGAAQMLAQTRPGAKGVLLFHGAAPLSWFGDQWPDGVPLQVHTMDKDKWVELDVARGLVDSVKGAELFLYPGSGHLFVDEGTPDYDAEAAALLTKRALHFLG